MRDPRSFKRRRMSDESGTDRDRDGDGDEAMPDIDDDIFSIPSSPTRTNEKTHKSSSTKLDDRHTNKNVTPKKLTGRRTPPNNGEVSDNESTNELSEDMGTPTPSRHGLRSSARQRRPAKKYEEEVSKTASSARKSRSTPSKGPSRTRSLRSSGRDKAGPKVDGTEAVEHAEPKVRSRTRRKSTKTSTDDTARHGSGFGNVDPSHEESVPDGIDDLVAMQIQQDFLQNGLDTNDVLGAVVETLPEYAESFQTLCQGGLCRELRLLTKLVLEKLNGKRPIPMKGLQAEYQKVYQLVEQTVTVGEGNSMLLLGSRGSGKTAMVEAIIRSLSGEHKTDFHVIRLNGFLHTDDRLALREMWRQLGRETHTEDETAKVNNYADTMATLLALLSHPEEIFGPSQDAETMTAAKSVVIVLDEFDLFASHPRQTLLYNLFDIAQARKAPIAVIGLTTKVDVTEMLEKRVKSRFSHRYVYLPLPKTFDTFSEICMAGVDLEDGELSDVSYLDGEEIAIIHSMNWRFLLDGWKHYVKGLWADEDLQIHLRRIFNQTKCVKEFFTSALVALSDLHHSAQSVVGGSSLGLQVPTPKAFTTQTLSCPDPAPLPFSASTTLSSNSSSLPLSLLLAATRLTALYDPGVDAAHPQGLAPLALSFPAAYAEYVRLLTSAKVSASASGATATAGRVWSRDVAREAWEKLVNWGLVVPVGGGTGSTDGRMFRVEVSFEEVVEMVGSGGSLGKWWRDA